MEAFIVSTAVVALAEIGDKTQLLALVLACRYRRPLPIILGILAATLGNHALAGAAGAWVAALLDPQTLRWLLGLGFLAFSLWALIPDHLEEDEGPTCHRGAFLATLIAFFLVEMGDKTQVATVALAAQFSVLGWVVAGTTLGMLLANAPVVILGHKAAERIPARLVRGLAASSFAALGLWALLGAAP